MSYKHKYYEPMDSIKGLIEDYPILEPCYTLTVTSTFDVETLIAQKVNDLLDIDLCAAGEVVTNELVHKILDILEDKELIHNE